MTATWTVARIAEVAGRESASVYGVDTDPGAIFGTVAEMRAHVFGGYGFDPLNEVLGFQLLRPDEEDDPGGPYTLLLTVALPAMGALTEWTCEVAAGDGEELSAFLTQCRAAAARRVSEVWPLPDVPAAGLWRGEEASEAGGSGG